MFSMLASDTSRAAREIWFSLLSELSPVERLRQTFELSNQIAAFSKAAIKKNHPDFTDSDITTKFIEIHYGLQLAKFLKGRLNNMIQTDLFKALKPMVDVFEKLQIRYYIGGSVASSHYGAARSTLDVDLVAEIFLRQIGDIFNALKEQYYIDKTLMSEAIEHKRSFNLIHLATAYKIDIFLTKERDYDKEVLNRTVKEKFQTLTLTFSSPEDVILAKCEWYKKSNQVLKVQLKDIEAMFAVQKQLDIEYLRSWSKKLGVFEILSQFI